MTGRDWLRVRRIIDFAGALALGVVAVPIVAVASLSVLASERMRPMLTVVRVGRHLRQINVTKIRTMHATNGEARSLTVADDDRVTSIGRCLRALHIDELPQLASVVLGDMALIGPRPEAPRWVDQTSRVWRAVLVERPGMCGLTQVIAAPWEARYLDAERYEHTYGSIALPAKLAIDLWYVEHASPLVDLTIIVSLVQAAVFRRAETAAHRLVRARVPEAAPLLTAPVDVIADSR